MPEVISVSHLNAALARSPIGTSLALSIRWKKLRELLVNAAIWKKKKKNQTTIVEDTNREGQWTREYPVRAESWPMIEQWAHDADYHMVACKAHRRMYKKGSDDNYYSTYLDIKHDETRVVLTAWIQIGFRLRLFTLFLLPKTLLVEGTGFRGIRTKRQACRDLNMLLERFRQRHIVGSENLHLADLDFTSLLLMTAMATVLFLFSSYSASKLEVVPGLSNSLLSELLNRVSILLGVGAALFGIHHWAVAKRMEEMWKKTTSAIVLGLIFTGLSLFQLTRTSSEMAEQKVSHHCLLHYDAKACTLSLSHLSPSNREKFISRLDQLHKELAVKK